MAPLRVSHPRRVPSNRGFVPFLLAGRGIALGPGMALDPQDGLRMFALSTKVEGQHPGRAAAQIHGLGQKERDRLLQDYAQDLPPSYRALLDDYYEALGK